jgi:hypothetical protein
MTQDRQPQETGTEQPEPVARPLATSLAVLAALIRLVPNLCNFTPVGALCLYAGGRLRSWHAFALPLVLMLGTNVILALWHGSDYLIYRTAPVVYASFLVNVLLGRWLCRTQSPWRIGTASLLASLQFFLVTNFAEWLLCGVPPGTPLQPGEYPHDLAGLIACYVAALPFFGTTLVGDLLFSGVLFGLHAVLTRASFRAEAVEAVPSSE